MNVGGLETSEKLIKIREPYWGAWKKYGWEKGRWGIGLKADVVDEVAGVNGILRIEIGKVNETLKIKAKVVQHFAKENNTEFTAKNKTRLYVIPKVINHDKQN